MLEYSEEAGIKPLTAEPNRHERQRKSFRFSLRGQTVHWIGAQFYVCMFLDSRDKLLNMLKICRNDQREGKNKRRTKGASLLQNPLTIHNMHSLAS